MNPPDLQDAEVQTVQQQAGVPFALWQQGVCDFFKNKDDWKNGNTSAVVSLH
ncbi:MAG: hypothetical protein RQ714_07940 [Nitrosomonas sp.]|nr:hypothetical protein [Nitrosomonas sp.]